MGQHAPIAKEMSLAFLKFHKEEDNTQVALDHLRTETMKMIEVNVEYKLQGVDYVTLRHKDKTDINKSFLRQGNFLITYLPQVI